MKGWVVGADGWVEGIRRVVSPNCDDRPAGAEASLLVLHGISLPPGVFGGDGIERLFTNRLEPAEHPYYATVAGLRVSAHFLVQRDGGVVQFVPVTRRAWHAGPSSWRGRSRCNDFSLGVELEGTDDLPYEERQYDRLAALVRSLAGALLLTACAAHSEIAPARKSDPGPAFDWARFHTFLLRV
jgi:N-acetyl-anhydromuramoyl-L-alanine amidase